MFWKKKNKSCKHTQEKPKADESKVKPNRRIIDGKLYDTSRAKKILNLVLSHTDIPNYNLPFDSLGGQEVVIYKGISEWFIEYSCFIEPVSENWVKDVLGRCDLSKYIELFGEAEEA